MLSIYSTGRELSNIDGANKAAGVAYYAILSIFPLLPGLIALFGFLLSSLNIQDELLKFVGDHLPGATDILKQNIATL
jgi:membrane protein